MNTNERRYELIVWDWETALLWTPRQRFFSVFDFSVPEDLIVSYVIGLGIHDLLRRVVPTIDPKYFLTLVDRFRYHYLAKDYELHLFEDMRDLLESLETPGFYVGGGNRQAQTRARSIVASSSVRTSIS